MVLYALAQWKQTLPSVQVHVPLPDADGDARLKAWRALERARGRGGVPPLPLVMTRRGDRICRGR